MTILFDRETHTYSNGETGQILISATQLMEKHHLSPDYSKVDKEVLKAKAERGTLIHKEIEDYIREGKMGFTEELEEFVEWRNEAKPSTIFSEFMVANDIAAGTVDLMFDIDGVLYIADIKTTYQLHMDALSWQLSIYNALLGYTADVAQVFHFDKNGKLVISNVPLKPKEEVEKLFECERNGEIYERHVELISPNQIAELTEAELLIEESIRLKKEGESRMKKITEGLKVAMVENGVFSFKTEKLQINLVKGYEKESVDTAKLREMFPDVYEKVKKTSTVATNVRVQLKDE